jgi:hypothetical protein
MDVIIRLGGAKRQKGSFENSSYLEKEKAGAGGLLFNRKDNTRYCSCI